MSNHNFSWLTGHIESNDGIDHRPPGSRDLNGSPAHGYGALKGKKEKKKKRQRLAGDAARRADDAKHMHPLAAAFRARSFLPCDMAGWHLRRLPIPMSAVQPCRCVAGGPSTLNAMHGL